MKIGLEIESPFKFYFPSIYNDFLISESYNQFSEQKLKDFNKRIDAEEPFILEKLTRFSNENNLKRGRDRYWEFVFPPTDSIQNHKVIISKLIKNQLLPTDIPCSLHITISGISKIQAYAILFLLELRFVDSERISSGFLGEYDKLTWNRKGVAGIATKHRISLIYDDLAFELRTLMVKPILINEVLNYLHDLINGNVNYLDIAKTKLKQMGLPFTVWGKEDFARYTQLLKNKV